MEEIGNERNYGNWVLDWLIGRKEFIKESTYSNYENIIYNHIIPKLGTYKLNEITNKVIQKYIIYLYNNGRIDKSGGLSSKTIKDVITIIKLSLREAMKEKIIDYIDLDLSYPKNKKYTKIKYFNKLEQRKINLYCLNNFDIKNMGILLSLYTGIRIGELCALRWEDISFSKNTIYITKTLQRIYVKETGETKVIVTTPKTKNSNREIPLNKNIMKLLRIFKTDNNNYILTNSTKCMEPRNFRRYYHLMIEKTGISNIPFHSLRHTFASNCIRLGGDYKAVSELLGHASVNITLNIYVHPQMSEKKRCANLLFKENSELFLNTYETYKYLTRSPLDNKD